MADIFNEIDEELRQDKAQELWKRYGTYIVAVCVVIIAAVAGYSWFEQQRLAELRGYADRYGEAVVQAEDGDVETALGTIDALIAEAGDEGVALMARFQKAALLANEGKNAEAADAFDAIAADGAIDVLYRDLATVKAVLHASLAGEDRGQLLTRIEPLTADGQPWRFTARMIAGSLAIGSGDIDRAKTFYQQVSDDDDAPNSARTQAVDILQALGS